MTFCLRTILLFLALFTNVAAAADTNNTFGQETGSQFSSQARLNLFPLNRLTSST